MNVKRFFKQENTGQWWGGFKAIISSASSYASWASMAMQAVTLYFVAKSGISIWVFALVIVVFAIGVMIFEWKVTIPSAVRFTNAQAVKHDNPIYEEIVKLRENQEKIMEKLKIDSK
jgi:hypothetical protein